MGATGYLKKVKNLECYQCGNPYGNFANGKKGHSKKQFMTCLHSANYKLMNIMMQKQVESGELKLDVEDQKIYDNWKSDKKTTTEVPDETETNN